ncbi:MAG TPA: prepilin-type N-terminal cleavage/methylation domain-containing protein [Phycisphaerae bacterium]|nr:prepilin-type N-terminal cleavage/methylation domain-containing protein [Phycisphaerae bacterium]
MKPSYRRSAFTLIELLTVMAIITLLIGILTPALGAARDRAKTTAVRAQLNAMEVGLESFNGDEGKYPPSNANQYAKDPANPGTELTTSWQVAVTASNLLQGANLLVDALVGRDLLGYDPKPGTVMDATADSRWNSARDRRQPYIPVDGVDLTSLDKLPEDGFGHVPGGVAGGTNSHGDPQPTINNLLCRVFKDKFGYPILYYRASPTTTQNTPIIQTGTNANAAFYGDGVYDGSDNAKFTSYATGCPQGGPPLSTAHRICDAPGVLVNPVPAGHADLQYTGGSRFAEFIRSVRATTYDTTVNPPTILVPRAVKADRFILLSAGKDGIFGTLDDVANFQALSTER